MMGNLNRLYEYVAHVFWVCLDSLVPKGTTIIHLFYVLGVVLYCCFFFFCFAVYAASLISMGICIGNVCVRIIKWGVQAGSNLGSVFFKRLRNLSGGNNRSSTLIRWLPDASEEDHALWDRWLDGY